MSSIKGFSSLKSSKEFHYFYNNSKKRYFSWGLLFYKAGKQKKFAFVASKKVGNSVKRNFAKRRMRAIFINSIDSLKCGTYLFVAKKEIIEYDFKKLQHEYKNSLKSLGALKYGSCKKTFS